MFHKNRWMIILAAAMMLVLLAACGKSADTTDYEHLRDVSWEGKELTIKLGENKSTGCVWDTKPQDDSVIDYSLNRVFHLADSQVKKGDAIGTLEAGFEGKGAGTSQIVCTTPVGWDGSGEGLSYIVTVTVKEDGTIESAEGEESAAIPADNSEPKTDADAEADQKDLTLEEYFADHEDELNNIKKSMNEDESYKDLVTIDLTVKENTLSYIYTFKETYSDEQIEGFKPDLKTSMEGEVKTTMQDKIKEIESQYGISGVKLYMEYRNGDGTKIYGTTYE